MATEKRLIDANELESRLAYQSEVRKNNMNCFGALVIDEIISNDLAASPTVDAVEVVHGYWIDSYSVDHIGRIIEHSIDCSVCDSVFKDESREVVKHWKERFEMCPFCGAKMDGDGNGT